MNRLKKYFIPGIIVLLSISTALVYDDLPWQIFIILGLVISVVVYPEISIFLFITDGMLISSFYHYLGVKTLSIRMTILGLLAIGGLIALNKNKFPAHNKGDRILFFLILALGIVLLAGIIYSPDKSYGVEKTIFYFLYNFLSFITVFFLFTQREHLENLSKYSGIITIALLALSVMVLGKYGMSDRFDASGRGNVIWYGRTLGLGIIFLIHEYRTRDYSFGKPAILIVIFGLVYLILLTGSRGPLLSLLLSIVIAYMIFSKAKLSTKSIIVISFVLISVLFITIFFPYAAVRATNLSTDQSGILRIYAAIKSVGLFFESPLIGWGTGSFTVLVNDIMRYPHNVFIELALENGLLGLLVFSSIIIYVFLAILKRYKKYEDDSDKNLFQLIMQIFIYALLNAQFSGDIAHNPLIWFSAGAITIFGVKDEFKKSNLTHNEPGSIH